MDDDQTDPGSKPGHEQPETPHAQAESPQDDLNSAAVHADDPTLPESAPVVPEQSTEAPPSKLDVELLTPKPASPTPPAQDAPPPPQPDSAAPDPPSSSSAAMLLDDPLPPSGPPQASSARPSPVDPNRYAPPDRPLNVTDALSYLDAVKVQFQDQPDVYNQFLDIMKEFKNELIDTPGVIMRVSQLFHGHPSLIQGFNTFLPVGYRIECSTDAQDSSFITVTTPSGTTTQATNEVSSRAPHWPAASAAIVDAARQDAYPPSVASPDPKAYGVDGQAIEPAVQYVQKIKQRCDPETYRQFLDILSQYHSKPDAIDEDEVSKQIARLFKDDPDLRSDFRIFMPERSQQLMDDVMISPPENRARTGTPSYETKGKRKLESATSTSALPPRRKRKAVEREREHETVAIKQTATTTTVTATASISRSKYATGQDLTPASYAASKQREVPQQPPPPPSPPRRPSQLPPPSGRALPGGEDSQFFDRVKRFVDNRETYNEFLKVVNLFTQDYIDMARLVKESRAFLGDGELMKQFKDILGWSERQEREHYLQEQQSQHGWTRPTIAGIQGRPSRADLSVKYGSYRRLPESEINVACSGRDEMCRSVLNDEWISHPTWSSEDSGFIAHKKNIYEEALHRSEEERHEYDFHIEAIVRTIAMLEPINNKIAQLSPDERGNFKLKPNLGGSWKSIHQRVIKKIYGRAAGLEVIQAMQDSPALAIPVVLQRLKQKEEEWKRAQREWNKVWRDVDARNYIKSLDHQSIYFKSTDKKSLTTKAFLSQIEAAREEQMAKRASFIDPLFARTRPRHQLEFTIDNVPVLQDALKLTFSYLDRVQTQVNFADRRRIEGFLRSFVPLFFALDPVAFNAAFVVVQETVDSEMSDDMGSVVDDEIGGGSGSTSLKNSRASGGGASGNRRAGSSSGDLRKKLLKSEQAKSTSRKTRAQDAASPSISRLASPVLGDEEHRDLISQARKQARRNIFFTNLTFYVLLRLIEVLYSRLKLFKDLGSKMAAEGPRNPRAAAPNGLPYLADLSAFGDRATNAEHYYELLLETCERLFDNEIEQHAFEDQIRAMFSIKDAYKIFTIDKVIGAIVKQVQAVFNDPKNQELLEILKRERSLASPTTQDQINSRRNTEKVLGPDENLFRIDWLPESKVITIQLIGKDDSSFDDSEVLTGRWQAYIESFVSSDATEGVNPSKVRLPYLRRNLRAAIRNVPPDVVTQDGLEIKICVRTYRLFFVSNTEDFMRRFAGEEEVQKASENVRRRGLLRARFVLLANFGSNEVPSSPGNNAFEVRNPATGQVVGISASANSADCKAAIESAARAFKAWERTSIVQRRDVFLKAADLAATDKYKQKIMTVMREETATVDYWCYYNWVGCSNSLRVTASMFNQLKGETFPSTVVPGARVETHKRALGVILGIAPWNAPVTLALRAVAVPILCGNTVILKSSEYSPRSQSIVVELFHEAGLPKGVLNFLSMSRETAPALTAEIIAHPAVRKINFTGSDRVGRIIATEAAKYLKPCVFELGGKAPVIVLDDANVVNAARAIVQGSMAHSGQICMSTERVIVQRGISSKLIAEVHNLCNGLKAGNQEEDATANMSALFTEGSAENVLSMVREAQSEGATLVLGDLARQGAVVQPHLLTDVKPGMRIWDRETFGPVAVFTVVDTVDEAVEMANSSEYSLTSGVWTMDLYKAQDVATRLNAGYTNINGMTVHSEPLAGLVGLGGASGYGRFDLNSFTETRVIVTHPVGERSYPLLMKN